MRQIYRFAVGAVLADSLSVLGRNWVTFLPLSLIAFAPFAIIKVSFDATAFKLGFRSEYFGVEFDSLGLIDNVVIMLCAAWLGGGFAFGVVNTLRGTYASHWEIVRAVVPIMPLLLLVVLVLLLVVLAGLVLLVVPGLVFLAALFVTLPAAAMERIGPLRALSRSWHLTRGWRWQIFGLVTIVLVVGVVADELVCLATGVCYNPWQTDSALAFCIDFTVGILLGALEATVVAVSYYHLVVLKEGSETSVVASVFD